MSICRFGAAFAITFLIGAVVVATEQSVPPAKECATAWGKPVHGLQAGVRCPKDRQTIATGEKAEIEIVIRNVSDKPIEVPHVEASYFGEVKSSTVAVGHGYDGNREPHTFHIGPHEEMVLGSLTLGHIRPKNPKFHYDVDVELALGKYQVGADSVLVPLKENEAYQHLGTGYLDLELVDKR
jgi:hypothetical protein